MAKVTLEIRYANRPAELRTFEQPKITLGREAGHIALFDPQASGQHGEFVVTDHGVSYTDVGSTNGTYFADGRRITAPVALSVGMEVRIGSSAVVLRSYEAAQRRGASGTLVMQKSDALGKPDDALAATFMAGSAGVSPFAANAPAPGAGAYAQQPGQPTAGQYPGAQPAPGQYPGAQPAPGQYPGAQAAPGQYAGAQHPGAQPAPGQYPGAQLGGGQYPGAAQYPGASPTANQYPGAQAAPAGAQPGAGQYPGAGYAAPGAYAAPAAGYAAGAQPGFAQPQQPYAAPGGAQPGYGQAYAAPGVNSPAPAGGFAQAYPGAAGPGGAGALGPLPNDPVELLKRNLEDYRPHLVEGTKVLGMFLLPLSLLGAVGVFLPLGGLLGLLSSLGYLVVLLLFGIGAQAEFAQRLAAGAPISAQTAWRVQKARMFPWIAGAFVPLLIANVGCLITFVLFGLFVFPVYMIERRSGFEVNKRSMEIASKNWGLAVVPLVIVLVGFGVINFVVSLVLGFIPVVGAALLPVWTALTTSLITPLISFIQFRVYFAILQQHEGTDAAALVRSQPVA